ncbi:Glutamate receptor ionotropic, delta-1 [Folsomia candida]|uniref:Glutamate receptor ionotropic, delta-1 n=1 Tax=Folsomia candida TaxID=158441 RepID=A0A226E3Q9_FOLCA|nr:Glutamate receptor ionotropic, delta-1 [Folsomia candida]
MDHYRSVMIDFLLISSLFWLQGGVTTSFSKFVDCTRGDAVLLNNLCVRCLRPSLLPILNSEDTFRNVDNPDAEWISCPSSNNDLDRAKVVRGSKFLSGRKVRVVTIERRPFVKILEGKFSGVCFELFYTMQHKYNFSREIFLPYDGNWGTRLPNGSWDGMVGLVQSKNADMGVAGFSVTLERFKVVAFTESFHQEPTAILIPPPTAGEKFTVLVRPLSIPVWGAVAVTMLTFAPTVYIMHILSLRIRGEDSSTKSSVLDVTVQLFHFMVSSLVQQSVTCPGSKTNRFLIILWWMMTIIVSSIYVAYLVSYLSAPRLFNVVNSLDDLVKQRKIKWTFRKSSALESLFKEKSFLDVALEEDFQKTHICKVTLAKQIFFKVETALIAQKRSELLAVFDNGIRWAVSSGLMEKWKSMHWPKDLWCADAAAYILMTQPKTRKLDFEDVQGASFLLGCGLTFAILVFIIEISTKQCNSFWKRIITRRKFYFSN